MTGSFKSCKIRRSNNNERVSLLKGFNQNFVEDINGQASICPGEYDFDNLHDVLRERKRFKNVVELADKIRGFMSREAVSELFTHHYFIHCHSFNDGLAAATDIYYSITDKYNHSIGERILNMSDMRNLQNKGAGKAAAGELFGCDDEEDGCPNIFIFQNTDKNMLVNFDRSGIKICFIIYSEDIPPVQRSQAIFGNYEEAAVQGLPEARQAAAELHYTYIDIPADDKRTLAEYMEDFFKRRRFDASGVKEQMIKAAALDFIKDEYSAVAAAKNILNYHLQALNEEPRLIPADFGEYVGRELHNINAANIGDEEKNKPVGLLRERKELNNALNGLILDIKRQRAGAATASMGCNMVFAGAPGTAKTTLARMFARALADKGIIPSADNFKECRKSDIIGKYVGFTASMIDKMFSQMHQKGGGVIFFDEVYSLSEQEGTCYDKEAINCITQNIENYRQTVYCIFAGYKNKMKGFIDANPGLSSRISATILFDDYDNDTLCSIFDNLVKGENFVIEGSCRQYLTDFFDDLRKRRGENFGNGREVRNLFEGAKRIMASRVISANENGERELSTIKAEEVKEAADTILASVIEKEGAKRRTIGF